MPCSVDVSVSRSVHRCVDFKLQSHFGTSSMFWLALSLWLGVMPWCWLASLPDLNTFGGKRSRINALALCNDTRAGLRELDPALERQLATNGPGVSFAQALVEVTALKRYTLLTVLNRCERAQLKLFQILTGEELANEIVFLTVPRVRKLNMPVPLVHILGKRHNGCWAHLFANEEMSLAGHLADPEHGQPPAGMPLFRAPLPYVLLVVNHNWSTIAILDQANSTSRGGRRREVPWEAIGFSAATRVCPTWVSEHVCFLPKTIITRELQTHCERGLVIARTTDSERSSRSWSSRRRH